MDRAAYLGALQAAQAGHGTATFEHFLYGRLDETLTEVLAALWQAIEARS